MPHFSYKARRRTGEVVQGTIEVADRTAAVSQIERWGLFPVLVEMAKGPISVRAEAAPERSSGGSLLPASLKEFLGRKRKPKMGELATFTQQLANLLHAGMPLTIALHSLTYLQSKGIPPEVSRQLRQDVMEGKGLSDAMAKQSRIFSDLYVNMVRAGEQSGALEEVLRRLATHYERFAEVQQKFTSALIYPAIVACVGIVIIFFFMTFMLPRFVSIFSGMKVPFPPSTRALIALSTFMKGYWWTLPLVVAAGVVVFKRYQSSDNGRRAIDRWKITLPVVGKVIRLNLFGQFARTLATLLQNGVPVLMALKITEQIVSNSIVKEAINRTREEVTDGKTLAQPLGRSGLFPQLMIDLIKIGEETGDVPGALLNVAETYENELTIALRVMTNMIEPAIIIVMAIGVGGLLFSIFSALFTMTSNIAR